MTDNVIVSRSNYIKEYHGYNIGYMTDSVIDNRYV